MALFLIGAGGHARAIVEALEAADRPIDGYVDPRPADWLAGIRHITDDDAIVGTPGQAFALGVGAVDPEGLRRRLALFERYAGGGWSAPAIVHPAARVSRSARLGAGAIVLAGACVQPAAVVGAAAIVNTGAIIEHDCRLAAGSHVAPGAIVLGAARIGRCCMIGAGAVVLPGAEMADGLRVPALGRFPA